MALKPAAVILVGEAQAGEEQSTAEADLEEAVEVHWEAVEAPAVAEPSRVEGLPALVSVSGEPRQVKAGPSNSGCVLMNDDDGGAP